MTYSPMNSARAWFIGFGLAAAAVPQAAAAMQSDRELEIRCRQNAMPACSMLNETVSFNLNTGQQTASVGTTDPIWMINGLPTNTVENVAWRQDGRATWVSSAASGRLNMPAGEYAYTANIWFDQDPYLYDYVRTSMTIGADDALVSIAVNGIEIFRSESAGLDFDEYESVIHDEPANWPWVRGCNEIRVTTRNTGGPSALTVRGEVQAQCSQCLSERPARRQ